jgi:hypothetical protein
MTQGYYSLIQYCPDWLRLEVCNVGVLLFCPELQYLDVAMTQTTSRIRSIFGAEHNIDYVRSFKDVFARRIRREKENILNLEALCGFVASRANNFRITEPRSMAVYDTPDQELQRLFRKVFDEVAKPTRSPSSTFRAQLRQAIREYGVPKSRIIFDFPKVTVPGFSKTITPYFGFLNGRLNLVVVERITAVNSFSKISYNLLTGQKLYEQQDAIWGAQQLYLLVETDDSNVEKQVEENRRNFTSHNVALYTHVRDMADMIYKEARDVPEEMRRQIIALQSA